MFGENRQRFSKGPHELLWDRARRAMRSSRHVEQTLRGGVRCVDVTHDTDCHVTHQPKAGHTESQIHDSYNHKILSRVSAVTMRKAERDAAIEHATQIKQLVRDPSSFLTELHVQQQQYYSIEWLMNFSVLSQVPLPPQATPYSTIATKAKVPESTLRSVARMAMTTGFLCETPDGHLSHNDLSVSFVANIHLRTQLNHMFNATIPVMAGLVQATEKWGDTRAPNETAYNIANDTDLPFFAHLEARPELQKGFEDYMKSRAVSHTGSSAHYLLDAFDWEALGNATVVDVSLVVLSIQVLANVLTVHQVGGSSGSTAIMLATAHPHLNVVVEDLAGPIESATARIAELQENVQSRIQAFEHDFFQPQPQKGADVYLLRTILHDWPDADAVKIVKGIVDAMAPSSRLLIMDMVLPKPGSGSRTHEAALRQKDLMMIGTFNAKEREVEEWSALLESADARLRICAIKRPVGSELSVIDVSLEHGETVGANVNGEHKSALANGLTSSETIIESATDASWLGQANVLVHN